MMCTAHHWSLFLSGFHLGEEKVGEKSIALPNKKKNEGTSHSYLSIEATPLQWLLSSVPKAGDVRRFIYSVNSVQVFLQKMQGPCFFCF